MATVAAEKIARALWSGATEAEERLYAILDGARNEGIYAAVATAGCAYECLYPGELAPDMAEVAPYLVSLSADDSFTRWIIEKGWGNSWGVFVRTPAELRLLRQHMRSLATVYSPDLKPMYFRFYDPRVLRAHLPACKADELARFFGPVSSFLLEDDNPGALLHLSNASGKLGTHRFALAA